jgi:hypothetical protein
MRPNTFPARRAFLRALAGVLLVSTSRSSFGQETGEKGAAKKSKGSVLTVVVTGKGKLIPEAEVKVKFSGVEERRPTNQSGEASFNFPGTGPADVRVIVAGWEGILKQVQLEEGPQRLTIELKALPDGK